MVDKGRGLARQISEISSSIEESGESKGNVNVVCRFRPLNQKEKDMNEKPCVDFGSDGKTVIVKSQYETMGPQTFNFDRVFNPDSIQNEVYEVAARPIVDSVLEGFNGTVLTYGQTSSGKTHTMTGPSIDDVNQRGIIPRMVNTVFTHIENSDDHLEFTVKVAYCEIYLEKIRDLLSPDKNNLKISEDKNRGIYIVDLTEEYVINSQEVYNLMKTGHSNREVGYTHMNEGSSRSHAIFSLTVTQTNTRDLSSKSGKLYLVDLAGSEKVGKTGAEGKRLDEAKNINKSLSTLGLVIFSLTDGKSTHVPYRDSKLTRVLQDSLGGNSKTSLIITCSPASYNEPETLSTLRFGIRAKAIKNKPKVNKEYSVAELKMLLNQANEMIAKKESRVVLLEKCILDNNIALPSGITGEELKEETMANAKEYQEAVSMLEIERQKLVDELENSAQLKQSLDALTAKNVSLARENDNLNSKMMNLLFTMNTIEEKCQDAVEESEKYKTRNEGSLKHIQVLEESIKMHEARIVEQGKEIARIPIDFVPVSEKEGLLREVKELKSRFKSQEEELKKSYHQALLESNQNFEKLNQENMSKDELLNVLKEENEKWTEKHQKLMADLELKNSIIEKLENERELLRTSQDEESKVKQDSDSKLKEKVNSLEKGLEQLTVHYQLVATKYASSKVDIKNKDSKLKQYHERIKKLERTIAIQKEEMENQRVKYEEINKSTIDKPEVPQKTHARIKKGIKGGKASNARVLAVLSPESFIYASKPETESTN
jgi:kinesin family protein 5